MEPKIGHSVPKQSDQVFTPCHGKRAVKGRLRSGVAAFWYKAVGLALFYSCPYLYHALMIASYDTPIEEALLVTAPISIYMIALILYMKGAHTDAN